MAGSLTLADYITAVEDLGVPDMGDTLTTLCLNQAQSDIIATRLWNFRLTDKVLTNGTGTVSDLGVVHSAFYTDGNNCQMTVRAVDKRTLQDRGFILSDTTTGYPDYFYLDNNNVVSSYPLATFTLRYYANPVTMSAPTDTSVLPDEMQLALVYQAGAHAFARVGVLDLSQNYFTLAKQSLDSFDTLYNNDFLQPLPVRYPSYEP